MINADGPQRTLIEQIHAELIASIEPLKDFDSQTLQRLKKLIEAGELSKAAKVMEAISPTPE